MNKPLPNRVAVFSRLKSTQRLITSKGNRTIRLGLTMILALSIQACSSARSQPEVAEPVVAQPSQQNLEMIRALSQLNELKEELKLLRNAVEEMQFQQENADRRQQDLYQDIDGRLLSLESNEQDRQNQVTEEVPLTPSEQVLAQGQTGFGGTEIQTGSNGAAGESVGGETNTVTVVSATPSRSIPSSQGTGSSSVSLTEQEAYDAAFELLKQSRYQDAVVQFQAMANTWPQSPLADDALYWMAEANYVNREFEAALNGFRSVVERYPDSSRLPEAMLKVGYIQYDIGAYDQAANTFRDILARFPGHQVTVSAETRLRRIEQTIQ